MELIFDIWFFEPLAHIAEFFGGVGCFACDNTVEMILEWMRGEAPLGGDLYLGFRNIVTGDWSAYYIKPNFLTSIISPILEIAFWFLPESVYDMPLVTGVLVASITWFFVLALAKFLLGIIKGK